MPFFYLDGDNMKVFSRWQDGTLRICLSGELDHNVAKCTMNAVDSAIDEQLPRQCVLDMADVSFMDSSGIAVILRTNKHMTAIGGRMWVENCEGQALRVLDAAGIDRIVKVCAK
jgi:stage II sporulation protein AA (anti-sigma F factor antagonist)